MVAKQDIPTLEESQDNEMQAIKPRGKISWYYAPVFLFLWPVLFCAVVLPLFFHLPDGLLIDDEDSQPNVFIAERAEQLLFAFDMIGPKIVGSYQNENRTTRLILDDIERTRKVMLDDLFELEVDVQQVTGAFKHKTMINLYQSIQNIVVKFSSRNSTSESYLLINSHFDTKPGSPGAGDAGTMIVVMLEVLRVLATTSQTFKHPIVFLFNGAEENHFQGSHGFITQHKWAPQCKAVINLDSAGSGHREILFQAGPNHPWLMKYYSKNVKQPYAQTLAEEMFEAGIIQSDTDFRIFKNIGHVPGLDLAHSYNGYVYHTKYDKFQIVPRGTLQSTGNNVLALARAFADADELENPEEHADGQTVFFDYLGLYFMYYTNTQSIIINICVAVAALLVIICSLWRMTAATKRNTFKIFHVFLLIFGLHVIGVALAIGAPILIAVIFDSAGRTLTYFTNIWLVLGLYICPCLFGLCAPTLLYLSLYPEDHITKPYRLQMVLHSHAVMLALAAIIICALGVRSSYVFTLSQFFYVCPLIFNLVTTLHDRGNSWIIPIILSQTVPFLYFAYILQGFLCTMVPMMNAYGPKINPDIYIAGLCALATILAMGFLIPMINIFTRPKLLLSSLVVVTLLFSILAITPLGFPYRAKTNIARMDFMHVRKVFYEYDGSVSLNKSGFYFDFQDKHTEHIIKSESILNLDDMENIEDDCTEQMMCGLPLFNHRWYNHRVNGKWLPLDESLELPATPNLTLIQRTVNKNSSSVRLEFDLSGPPHMSIFLQPTEGTTLIAWSFLNEALPPSYEQDPPYHIFYSYGADNTPLNFFFEVQKSDLKGNESLCELGISAHYISFEYKRSNLARKFLSSLPKFIYTMDWPSSYERYIF